MNPSPAGSPRLCPVCGRDGSRPAFMAGGYRMYRCVGCRTAFVHPVPGDDELARFYSQYHLSDTAGGLYDEVEARMQSDFPAKVDLVCRRAGDRVGRLLDVGCGKGFFVKACRDRGIDAQGVDLSDTGVAYATGTLGVPAVCGDLRRVKGQLGLFDTVVLWATIEHLPDPIGTLRDIHDVLRPGGRVFVDTGIGDDWLDRLLPGVAQWYDPPQHLFVFSARGMTLSLEAAGFRQVRLDRCFERSAGRKAARVVRAWALAAGLRAAAVVGRMRHGTFPFTRYPVGNLMTACAVKPGAGGGGTT